MAWAPSEDFRKFGGYNHEAEHVLNNTIKKTKLNVLAEKKYRAHFLFSV